MLVERSVAGAPLDPKDKRYEKTHDTSKAEEFLTLHEGAKIVVIIDTHCLDSGKLVWSGTTADDLRACTLLEVS